MKIQGLKLGIPKGSLQEPTLRVFKEAGFDIVVPERGYSLTIDDPEITCFLLRPQEIPKYIEQGRLDLGFSGDDWISETGAKVVKVCDLKYAKQKIKKVRWVLAVPKDSDIRSVKDLQGKTVSTEAVGLAKNYLKKKGVKAKVEFSWGATEVKPPRFVDAIIDITETGASLKANNLKILDTVLKSSTKLIANKKAWQDKWKKEKIKNLALLLLGVIKGEEEVSLTMHVSEKKLKKVLKVLPDLKLPTIRKIVGQDWYSVAFDCEKNNIRQVIPKLKRMGCQGIIEFSATKIIR